MHRESLEALIGTIESIRTGVSSAREVVDREDLTVSDRQYLNRCLELLDLEADAFRQYLARFS